MPGHHAGNEQPADRGFGGDAVEDEGDRRRDQNAERAAGADRAGGDVVRVAAPAHFRNAHLADGGAAGGRRAGERGEDGAGAQVGNHQPARQAVEPAVERLVEVLAGGRGTDRRAHHHEHRDGDQRELVETGIERLGDDMHAVDALEDQQEDDRDRAEPEGDRHTRQQHQERRTRTMEPSVGSWALPALRACARIPRRLLRHAERRRPPAHQAEQFGEILQHQKAEPDRHRQIRNPKPRAPDRVRMPAFRPGLIPIVRAQDEQHHAEAHRQQARKQRQPVARTRAQDAAEGSQRSRGRASSARRRCRRKSPRRSSRSPRRSARSSVRLKM